MMKPWLLPLLILLASAGPAVRYVPATGWHRDEWAPAFHERWFGGHLRAMREPPLATARDLGASQRRFRLLVLPSFDHPFAFRIDEDARGRATLRQVVLDGRGGYDPGHIARESSRALTPRETARFDRAIGAARLKRLPMEAREPVMKNGTITICADGTAFVFELLDRNGRTFLMRSCLTPEQPLLALIDAVYRLDPRTDWRAASYLPRDR